MTDLQGASHSSPSCDRLQVDQLIRYLKAVDEAPECFCREDNSTYEEEHHVIREIVSLATEYLTVGPDVALYRQMVCKAGYPVYPGEVDGFGWLTAYFQMKRGILLFG